MQVKKDKFISACIPIEVFIKLQEISDRELKPFRTFIREAILSAANSDESTLNKIANIDVKEPSKIYLVIRVTEEERDKIISASEKLGIPINLFIKKVLRYYFGA